MTVKGTIKENNGLLPVYEYKIEMVELKDVDLESSCIIVDMCAACAEKDVDRNMLISDSKAPVIPLYMFCNCETIWLISESVKQ